ncbi:sulfurtransferase [Salegentibacter salinarum]|uniref:Sulfurtransferase n=1 Tax=Salegentibacter salinarum TaxID=447422 RepID=A0A2N0TXX6_9FLAO|nr:rhodanese-like domain-containing protein [Salegentibacter salinarum]PKD19581.1 sulfurtransferase [Salegentibacter salinarum]SKB42062.1 Rhodanese-related sulfurtransferase [Salegentibacter salinarum]
MINKLKELLGIKPPPDYSQLIKEGGIIIDVRTKAEYAGGHIKGSKNIPLQTLNANTNILKDKNKPVITCCASGMRSASAKSILKSSGFNNVYNGGSWASLQSKI